MTSAFPLWVVIAMQTFRIGVELLLHRLYLDGLAPRIVTYQGGNMDIWIGLSAPLIAWTSTRGHWGERLALGWNVAGALTLANAITLGALTAPGLNLIHAEVPNVAIGAFPFTYIAGFFAPPCDGSSRAFDSRLACGTTKHAACKRAGNRDVRSRSFASACLLPTG